MVDTAMDEAIVTETIMEEMIVPTTPEAIVDLLGPTPLLIQVIRFTDTDVTVTDVTVIPIGCTTVIHTIGTNQTIITMDQYMNQRAPSV